MGRRRWSLDGKAAWPGAPTSRRPNGAQAGPATTIFKGLVRLVFVLASTSPEGTPWASPPTPTDEISLEDRGAPGPGGAASGSSWSRTSASGSSGFPRSCSGPSPTTAPTSSPAKLRAQAEGIPDPVRAALALNMLTEEGLPHFHRLLAVYLGDDSYWRTLEQSVDRRGRPARRRSCTTTPGHPPVRSAEDRGDAVRVHPGRVPPGVGPGPLPGLRLHHGPGAGDPVLP